MRCSNCDAKGGEEWTSGKYVWYRCSCGVMSTHKPTPEVEASPRRSIPQTSASKDMTVQQLQAAQLRSQGLQQGTPPRLVWAQQAQARVQQAQVRVQQAQVQQVPAQAQVQQVQVQQVPVQQMQAQAQAQQVPVQVQQVPAQAQVQQVPVQQMQAQVQVQVPAQARAEEQAQEQAQAAVQAAVQEAVQAQAQAQMQQMPVLEGDELLQATRKASQDIKRAQREMLRKYTTGRWTPSCLEKPTTLRQPSPPPGAPPPLQ